MDFFSTAVIILSVILIAAAIGFFFAMQRTPRYADARPRRCPCCAKDLKPGENLVAERTGVQNQGREQIIIKGCPYCLGRKYEVIAGKE